MVLPSHLRLRIDHLLNGDFATREVVGDELVQLLRHLTSEEAIAFCSMLFQLIKGAPSAGLAAGLRLLTATLTQPKHSESLSEPEPILPVIRASRELITVEFSQFAAWIQSPDPTVREDAVTVVARSGHPNTIPVLVKHIASEHTPELRAVVIRELQQLAPADAVHIARRHLDSSNVRERTQAAIAICELTAPACDSAALSILMRLPLEFWHVGWVRITAVAVLRDLGQAVFRQALEIWTDRLDNPPTSIHSLVNFLIRTAFPINTPFPSSLRATEVSDVQRLLLRKVLQCSSIWDRKPPLPRPNIYDDLLDTGLPATHDSLALFVNTDIQETML